MGLLSCMKKHYNYLVLICVCLGTTAMGLPFFSYGSLLPYLYSFFYSNGHLASQASMALQPVLILLCITLTGSISGILELYMNVRLLNLILSVVYVVIIACAYFVDTITVMCVFSLLLGTMGGQIVVVNVARLTEWNSSKSGQANGIMGFFMGISGFIGSTMCTSVINPHNAEQKELFLNNSANSSIVVFTDKYVLEHTQDIWLAWAGAAFILLLPGVFILRPPTPEEVCEQNMILSGDSFESVELLPRPKKASVEDISAMEMLKTPKFYILYAIILILSLVLLTSTELYKFIGQEAISDDKFLNVVGASGAVSNAFGRIIWGLILDRFGTRATFTVAFFLQGPLTVTLHYAKWNSYGYLANIVICTFCVGIFTCIAPACQELFGKKDLALKYAFTLSAEAFGCVLFYMMQIGQSHHLFGELGFLIMMGAPSLVASMMAFCFFK